MPRNFLLTYSVDTQTSQSIDIHKADKVRSAIAGLNCWKKLKTVETTFHGRELISGSTDQEKTCSVVKVITDVIKPILNRYDASEEAVIVYCAVMIHGVEDPHEFEVKY